METIFVLMPLALLIAAVAVGFFVWAARTGQFDDLDTPPVRMLFDEEPTGRPNARVAASLPNHDARLPNPDSRLLVRTRRDSECPEGNAPST